MSQAVPTTATSEPAASSAREPRIAIFIVAYNAVSTLRWVLDRIPEEVWQKVSEVFVFDDSSKDDTYLVGLGYKEALKHSGREDKLKIFRNKENLGYGGNQIAGYKYAIENGFDIVALLHGDGQYAPECLGELLAPLERGDADAVFGSRMMRRGDALKGGMPMYKYLGNKVLTTFENIALGSNLSEFHSGYRIFSVQALKQIPFELNSNDFHFDTQIIIQFHAAGLRIAELPIPTYYGDEICHVNGMKYAKDVTLSIVQFKAHELGLQFTPRFDIRPRYEVKKSPHGSHQQLMRLVGPPKQRILDVGCGEAELSRMLEQAGHDVTALDSSVPREPPRKFIRANLVDDTWPIVENELYDVVLLADVLEHLPEPEKLLEMVKRHLTSEGRVLVSLPNIAHWSVRAQLLRGQFDYTPRGILDKGHLRFFTEQSARRLFEQCGFRVEGKSRTPVPWERVIPLGPVQRVVEAIDISASKIAPNVFAYQNLFELRAS